MKRTMITMAAVAASALALAACGSAESVGGNTSTGGSENGSTTLIVGSQDYYSNEIIAEAYAQALEGAGFTVDRQLRIGQREVYMPEIEAGAIDVFPEYTGNLLQYLDADATARSTDEVYAALQTALPSGLRALEQAPATDQDSYVVTADFAAAHSLASIGDLASAGTLTLGGNSELQTRPYGPTGLSQTYGVTVGFTPIEDSGGPLTVKALKDGDIQLANIYSSDPALADGTLKVLDDPKGLFLASHVVPLASSRVSDQAAAVINRVSAAMDAQDLVEMNRASTVDQKSASQIAREWLISEGLLS
ncbi:MAG: ABC transporter substrate-binding protein [Schaalia odontolytica]|uniref:Glycine/betaine ABC transporter n=2 Tax=Schaalia odontolytica TaxID=1660 RepID=A0A857A6A0_9ACTO|nr:ABC transporter substrate-binding protein [Schaalia odontolytica]EFF78671.1 ABC transporter, substrate-binding protein, QAT family [Schaalia odontolytica F0309]MDU5761150.1 ABC transporter substrate-binding protein [Schaalia odontolytica]QGS10006.1 glycine/betaine ABC transporter [Schaalia odontolytica]